MFLNGNRIRGIPIFAFLLFLLAGCVVDDGNQTGGELSGDLIIFHAGSLSVPFKEAADSFEQLHPSVNIQREVSGSVECARKISDLGRDCDIMASADYKVINKFLIPEHTEWLIKFAANEMALVYHQESKYHDKINRFNWHEILQKEEVLYGRSDPDSDPCGYRTVLSLRLSEKYYNQPGMANRILSKNQRYIRPKETDLLALLETNTLDYIFLYRSLAEQHGLNYLTLTDSINLGNPELKEWYNTVSVDIAGKRPGKKLTIHGEPMVYGVSMLKKAPNPDVARKFLHFLLSRHQGLQLLEKHGQSVLVPASTKYYENVPENFRQYVKR